jgi:hypothetical protein
VYKTSTANTLVLFATKALATATYASDAAAKTAGLDIKAGAAGTDHTFTFSADHTFTEAYADACHAQSTRKLNTFSSGGIDTSAAADAKLAVVAVHLYDSVSTGDEVVYSNGGGTDATALTDGTTYFVYKHSTANTLVIFATKALATATYANDAAAATAGLDIKAGAAGAAHTFTFTAESYDASALETSNVVSRSANTDVYHGQQYQEWDAGKIQGCKCDLGYDGPDCSHRISPHGDDPLTTVKSNMMKQAVKIYGKSSATFIREQFLMVYHDPYGGIWRTDAIDGTTNDNIAASRVQDALRALPNEVLEGVKVTGTASTPSICHRFDDGVQHLSAFEDFHIGHHKDAKYASNFCEHSHTELAIANDDMDFTIEFADKPGQTGVQYLFEVDVSKRGAGAFPMSGGITGASSYSVGEINYNANLGNLSELAECSDRGLDDGDGQCECFDGFRGLACEEQEALV